VLVALLAAAPAASAAKACKGGQVPVTVGKKTTCKPLAKAIPKPKAIDIRLAHLQEALKLDPAKSLKGKKAKKARKKLLKALPKALAFIDRKGGARRSLLAGGLAHASAGCDVGPAGATGQTGGASVGALGENGGYVNASAGGGIRVRVTFVTCKGAKNFRIPECPTANGSVDATANGEFRATVEVWDGDRLFSRNSSTFEDRAKAHGEVGADAKLKHIDVEHTQEVFIVASGGVVIRGGVTRKVRINMPGGAYDPANATVRFFGDPISANSGADAFASTAAGALDAYKRAEPRWSTFNPPGGHCAEPVFTPDSNTLKLRRDDRKQLAMYAKAKDGNRASAARWTLLGPVNAEFSPSSSEDPAPSISYTVLTAPNGAEVRVTVKFTSTAGVGERSWSQPIETEAINEISGTFSSRIENGGSIFDASGNARYLRFTPAIFSPPEGSFKLSEGLYTYTVSGKATAVATDQCSMRGSGQYAVHKESQFTVFAQQFDGKPPYSYNFEVSSENQPLPMVTIELYGCSESAEELEGDTFEYPATMSVIYKDPQVSPDGIVYAGSFEETGTNNRFSNSWNFLGHE
jgi:hypothetical protein